jgi:hypothetical protein
MGFNLAFKGLIRLKFKHSALFRNNFSKLEANEGSVEHKYLVESSETLQDSSEPSHAEQDYFYLGKIIQSCRSVANSYSQHKHNARTPYVRLLFSTAYFRHAYRPTSGRKTTFMAEK